jgi:hypothetical protein
MVDHTTMQSFFMLSLAMKLQKDMKLNTFYKADVRRCHCIIVVRWSYMIHVSALLVISGIGVDSAPSFMPSIAPSIDSATSPPSNALYPTMEPSGPSPAPSCSTSADCGYVELQYSSQSCYFTACGGTYTLTYRR